MKPDLKIVSQRFQQVWLTIPYKAGVLMIAFTKERFRQQNWLDAYPEKWKPRNKRAKRNTGRALLVDKGRLWRSPRIISMTANSVTQGTDVPYAAAHNDGYRGVVNVPQHVRKRFKKSRIEAGGLTKTGKTRMKTVKQATGETMVKAHTKRMNIPQRKFMGQSKYLTMQISRMIEAEILKTFR
jgi:phage gpG-like protein